MEGHVARKAQGGGSNLQISRSLNEEKSLGFFLSSGIDQGLSGLCGACRNIQQMDLLLGASNEGGFGGCEEAFCGVG